VTGLLIAALAASAAQAPGSLDWPQVQELKSGGDVRVYEKGKTQPILAVYGDATSESLIVIEGNRQRAIPRDQIERIDYRAKATTRLKRETKTVTKQHDDSPPAGVVDPSNPSRPKQSGGSQSTSTGFTFEGKGEFKTVYRAPSAASK
jgi:hypothetical protein